MAKEYEIISFYSITASTKEDQVQKMAGFLPKEEVFFHFEDSNEEVGCQGCFNEGGDLRPGMKAHFQLTDLLEIEGVQYGDQYIEIPYYPEEDPEVEDVIEFIFQEIVLAVKERENFA